jgi:hypothetical protein
MEILMMVYEYLPLKDLLACHRVSRHWCAIARSNPALYKSIDLTVTPKLVTNQSIKALVRYAAGNIRSLKMRSPETTFAGFKNAAELGVVAGYKHHGNSHLGLLFKNLESFEQTPWEGARIATLWDIPNFPSPTLRRLTLATPLSPSHLPLLPRDLEYLECLCFPFDFDIQVNFKSLLTLKIIGVVNGTWSTTLVVHKEMFPNLEEFSYTERGRDLVRTMDILSPGLKVLRVNASPSLSRLRRLPEDLKVLELNNLNALTFDDNSADERFPTQSRLEKLSLCNIRLQRTELQRLYDSATTLTKLRISTPQFEARDIEPFLREGVNLTYINISQTSYVNDGTLKLMHSLLKLECLEIDHCPGVTGHGIIQLVQILSPSKTGGRLAMIKARGNEGIRRQTVDWAWQVGVYVSI